MKRTYLIVVLLMFMIKTQAQDTTYFDNNNKVVKSLAECTKYLIIVPDSVNPKLYINKEFYKSGKKRSEYKMDKRNVYTSFGGGYEGSDKDWYENGQLRASMNHKNRQIDGELLTYWENGQIKRREYYDNGKMISSTCFNRKGVQMPYYPYHQNAEYPGKSDGIMEFIANNSSLYKDIDSSNPDSTYFIYFVINKQGIATNLTMPYHYNRQIYNATLKLLNIMPKWRPCLYDSIPCNSAVRIGFCMNKSRMYYLGFYYQEQILCIQYFTHEGKLVYRGNKAENEKLIGTHTVWFSNGKIKSEKHYNENKLDGTCRTYWGNNNIKLDATYKEGKLNGQLKTYWIDGTLKRNDVYKDGVLIEGHSYDPWGNPTEYCPYITEAHFPGGKAALDSFLIQNLHYPDLQKKLGIKGTVVVSFSIPQNGGMKDLKIKNGVNYYLDQEALRVVKKMPHWIPAFQDGESQESYITVPIVFGKDDENLSSDRESQTNNHTNLQ